MTDNADINQQSPKHPWITSFDSTPSLKNWAQSDICDKGYHSTLVSFGLPRGTSPSPYKLCLFFLLSFGWEPKSGSSHFSPSLSLLLNSSHFLIAASSEFNIVFIFTPFLSK